MRDTVYITCLIGMAVSVLICQAPIRVKFYIALFMNIFTGTAFCYVGENSILVCHICALVFFVNLIYSIGMERFYYHRPIKGIGIREPVNLFLWFFGYCFFSIFLTVIRNGYEIITVDGAVGISGFSLQQFTQYLYLVYVFAFMYAAYFLLHNGLIRPDGLWKCMDAMYLTVIGLGLFQLAVGREAFNAVFNNDAIPKVVQWTFFQDQKIIRMDSTFNEASMLAVFIVPLLGKYLLDLLQAPNLKTFMKIFLGFGVFFLNRSSSFFIGFAGIFISLWVCLGAYLLRNKFRIAVSIKRAVLIIIFFGIFIAAGYLLREQIGISLDWLKEKLTMQNGSGRARGGAFLMTMAVFRRHPLLGIGFGSLRSLDLFSNWLAQLGIIGFLLYLLPVGYLLYRMLKKGSSYGDPLVVMIVTYNVIMMAAVPEFRFPFIWIYYAMALYDVQDKHYYSHI